MVDSDFDADEDNLDILANAGNLRQVCLCGWLDNCWDLLARVAERDTLQKITYLFLYSDVTWGEERAFLPLRRLPQLHYLRIINNHSEQGSLEVYRCLSELEHLKRLELYRGDEPILVKWLFCSPDPAPLFASLQQLDIRRTSQELDWIGREDLHVVSLAHFSALTDLTLDHTGLFPILLPQLPSLPALRRLRVVAARCAHNASAYPSVEMVRDTLDAMPSCAVHFA